MPGRVFRIGTRKSRLATLQAEAVAARLRALGAQVELVGLSTAGDRDRTSSLEQIGGSGLFVKEIEAALLEKRIDLAVHSLKDLPREQPAGLLVAAIPERADPLDCFVSRGGVSLMKLPRGAKVGTSSPRRAAQLRAARNDLEIVSIRGNVETRIRRVEEGAGGVEATVLARAGLLRLGLEGKAAETLSAEVMLPAPGQGALAVESRADDAEARELAARIDDSRAAEAVRAERAVLAALGGGCQLALGALAVIEGDRIILEAALERDGRLVRRKLEGPRGAAERLGAEMARMLRE